MAQAGVVATLLPAAAFYLKLGRFAPARMLIERGVAVALATDVNPGGGFTPSMPFVMTLACFAMGMTLDEALVGATLNAAYAIGREADVGSLEAGQADGRGDRGRRGGGSASASAPRPSPPWSRTAASSPDMLGGPSPPR